MDRRQRKRILIYLVIPLLAAVPFISDDLIIRIISISLLLIYVAFIIFLRDSIRFDNRYQVPADDQDTDDYESQPNGGFEDSFEIISPSKTPEIITADDYKPGYRSPKTKVKPPDLKEKFEEIANEAVPGQEGPGEQFTFVLEKILDVIKDAYAAHTAIFFWYNRKKEKLSIDKYSSTSSDIARRKFDLEDDILSKIVQNGEPELLSDISPAAEADVVRYYSTPQGIRSFVGVPLFYEKQLIAILSVDSKEADAFGIETIYGLGRFVRVITMVISIFEDKHSDSLSHQRLSGILNLVTPESRFETEEDMIASVKDSMAQLIEWDGFTFIFFDPLEQKFVTKKVVNKTSLKYIGENLEVELNGTLTGKSILSGVPVKIDDMSGSDYKRFYKKEDVSFDGSFLALPVIYDKRNYGVLCFESLKKNAYSNSDVQFLKSASGMTAFIVHSFSTQRLLRSLISVDTDTRALNKESFLQNLKSDLVKAQQLKAPSALALIRIDDFLEQESLFDGNPLPKVLTTVADTIRGEINQICTFGRLGERVFGVYFFNLGTKEAFVWSEKLRVKIARNPIAVVSKQTTYTVSIGVASATGKTDPDEVLYNADLALQKALERGGNTVRNIN